MSADRRPTSAARFRVCVFCASSNDAPERYFEAARELGVRLAQRDWTLVYGGGSVGLMGAVARSVHEVGGRVVGVIPELLRVAEVAYHDADELVVTQDMAERKTVMVARSDAFLCLPGAFGTLDELFEVLTLRQLGYHDKPIVLVDIDGFWSPFVACFERLFADRLSRAECRRLYELLPDVASALERLARDANGDRSGSGRGDRDIS